NLMDGVGIAFLSRIKQTANRASVELFCDCNLRALGEVHKAEMTMQVILGEQKFVNTEAPRAIAGLKCFHCKAPIDNLRSCKCHNWAYAKAKLLKVLEQMNVARKASSK
ncbi:MAG: hypothetical protein ABI476_05340, partial [Oxalobacteraceae bacterium]